jgi:1,4-alpha-glucan branching enzyme
MLTYMFARPGKPLLFMGTELAPWGEWNHDASLDWNLLSDDPRRAQFRDFLAGLSLVYRQHPPLWRDDHIPGGFHWIDLADRDCAVISFARWSEGEHVVAVLNLTPVVREQYRIGVPSAGRYAMLLSTDDHRWGGSGHLSGPIAAEDCAWQGQPQSLVLTLPPLGALLLAPVR